MNQYALQKYFEKVCVSFFTAYTELKRLEKVAPDLTEELEATLNFWGNNMWEEEKKLHLIMMIVKKNNFSIIITKKEEIYALLLFFSGNEVLNNYRVINVKEEVLMSYPTDEKMYKEFLDAYKQDDEKRMRELYKKHF